MLITDSSAGVCGPYTRMLQHTCQFHGALSANCFDMYIYMHVLSVHCGYGQHAILVHISQPLPSCCVDFSPWQSSPLHSEISTTSREKNDNVTPYVYLHFTASGICTSFQ